MNPLELTFKVNKKNPLELTFKAKELTFKVNPIVAAFLPGILELTLIGTNL